MGLNPCPTSSLPLMFDCSGECIAADARYGVADCNYYGLICSDSVASRVPAANGTIRTPAEALAQCSPICPGDAGSTPLTGAVHFYYGFTGSAVVRVGSPWKVTDLTAGGPSSCPKSPTAAPASQCLVVPSADRVLVWTDDPNPPARNITIEQQGAAGCP